MLKRFISYYRPHHKMFILDMIASFFISAIGMTYPMITRQVFNVYVPNKNIQFIIIFTVVLLVLYIIRLFLRYFVQYYGHVIGVKMQAQMRKDMFMHLEDLPYSYFDEHETGKIMSRMTNDLMNVSELAHHGPENIFICGVMILGSLIYLMIINWMLALIVFGCVPILVIISLLLRKRMNEAFMDTRKDIATINAAVESSVTGIRVTKAFGNKEKEIEKFEIGNARFVNSRSRAYKAMGQFSSTTNFVTDLFNIACIIGGGLLVIYDRINLGDYLAFVISISLFITPLTTLINFVETYQDGVTGFKRFIEIMDEKPEFEKEDAIDNFNIEGEIKFENVSFAYNNEKEVLSHINFLIKKGETIALVGESGGGKTTICHLIPNFYHATGGKISIDGVNIDDFSYRLLRKSIGIVQQDVYLFNGTILENIQYGNLEASMEDVIKASKEANIYDYIMSLPNGFNTEIGERGVRLSGGQKQRLSIARVFLKNPAILILDEATSALDNTTEILIQDALNRLSEGRTTIVVAHRLSTIKNANRILVINDGHIVEEGSHEELIKEKGVYEKLYLAQFKRNEVMDF